MTLKDVTNCRFEKKKTSNDHQTQSDDQNPTIERHDNSILFSSKSYSFAAVFSSKFQTLVQVRHPQIGNNMTISSIERIE